MSRRRKVVQRVLVWAALISGAVTALANRQVSASVPSPCVDSGGTTVCSFASIGAEQTFTVPAGVTSMTATVIGAHGGSAPTTHGGQGAQVGGAITVTPGQTLYIEVGGIGSWTGGSVPGGFNGGGSGNRAPEDPTLRGGASGGGASDVRTVSSASPGSLASRIIVAGGGGGASGDTGNGGDAGSDGTALAGFHPGHGATVTSAGAGGDPGLNGGLGVGGPGEGTDPDPGFGGGGGGGGLFGGGGGSLEAGGGGGSSKVPSNGTSSIVPATTDPSVSLSFPTPTSAPTLDSIADLQLSTDPGKCYATLSSVATTAHGIPTPTVSFSPSLPAQISPPGSTVTATASNGVGDAAQRSFQVQVNDTEAPKFTGLEATINVNTTDPAGAVVHYAVPTATDNCSVTVKRTAGLAPGDVFPVGNNFVTYVASDAAGNTDSTTVKVFVHLQSAVTVTVPSDITYTLNGTSHTGTQSISLNDGTYSLSVPAQQSIGTDTLADFSSWSDGGAATHDITVAGAPVSVTGTFARSYLLTTAAVPANGGTVTPAAGGFVASGTDTNVSATPAPGFAFTGWTGPVASASSASTHLVVSAPTTITANFSDTIHVNVSGAQTFASATPTFTSTNDVPSVTLTGTLSCGKTTTAAINSALAVGTYTIDPTSCTGLTAPNGLKIVYTGVTDGYTVSPAALRLYPDTVTPPVAVALGSGLAVETAQRINFSCAGTVTGVWWYRVAADTGTNTVTAWRGATQIATGTGTPTTTGWVFLPFTTPVTVSNGDQLLLGVHHPNGAYGVNNTERGPGNGFNNRTVTAACMASPVSTAGQPNGLYKYTTTPALPTLSYASSEYFISPELTTGAVPPPPSTLSITGGSVIEGNSGTTPLTFTIKLSAPNPQPVTVTVRSNDGSATAPPDYIAVPPTTITFAAGETTKTIDVTVNGDTEGEGDETFTLTLSNPTGPGVSIGSGTATGTIINDDAVLPPVPPPTERLYADSVVPPQSVALGSSLAIETAQRINFTCSGAVTGVWWYRTAQDTGTDTVSAWKGATLVATATGNPPTTGWSYIAFNNNVPVSPGDQLIIGVHHPNGAYAVNNTERGPGNGFNNRSITSPCMTSPVSTAAQPNGLYTYTATPKLPTLSYASSEYFITPEFSRPAAI